MPTKSVHVFLLSLLLCAAALPAAQNTQANPDDARMAWWREARFGMFIHWTPASIYGTLAHKQLGGDPMFALRSGKIPLAQYAQTISAFNPVKFDPEAWVLCAKAAGMRYIVFTAKHHDGFAMWGSKVSRFNVVDATAYGRDVLAELAAACKKHGMRLGLYYSQARDWYHPGGAIGLGKMKPWDDAQRGDFAQYIRSISAPQVKELTSNYGTISILWWDTPDQMTPELAHAFDAALALQPGIITNSRLADRSELGGDFTTPERFIPAKRPHGRDMEVCTTTNYSWGYAEYDKDWKSPRELMATLIESASKGGNFLLNIGPSPLGEFPPESLTQLKAVGEWMRLNGGAIYGTSEGPFRYWANGRATRRGNTIYLHVLDWPKDGQLMVPLDNQPLRAHPMGQPSAAIAHKSTPQGLRLETGDKPYNDLASVIVLELGEEPKAVRQGFAPDANGLYRLPAVKGDRHGLQMRVYGDVVSGFSSRYLLSWPVYFEKAGRYEVRAVYASEPKESRGEIAVEIGDNKIKAPIRATASPNDFNETALGQVHIAHAGAYELELKTVGVTTPRNLRLRSIHLIPLD